MTDTTGGKVRLKVDNVVWREVDEELVVLELPTTTYLTLNGSAMQLWLRLVEGATPEELVDMLIDRYNISSELAKSDTESFLADLAERELLDHGG
jgi:hypothetical protein